MIRALITDNPVARREAGFPLWRQWPRRRKVASVLAVAGGFALLGLGLRPITGATAPGAREAALLYYGLMLALLATVIGARAIVGERELRTWEQVRMTRLRPAQIVVGKALGVLSQIGLIVVTTAPGLWIALLYFSRSYFLEWYWPRNMWYMLFTPAGMVHPTELFNNCVGGQEVGLFWVFATGLVWSVMGAAIGVMASLRHRSALASTIVAVILAAIVIGIDLVFPAQGGFVFTPVPDVPAMVHVQAALMSMAIVWGWPLVTTAVATGLAMNELGQIEA